MQQHNLPIIDAIDMEIIMHRDAHFGSSFDVMLEYYKKDGVGVMPDFEIKQIEKLKKMEQELEKDISLAYLPEPAKKIIGESQALYHALREAYSKEPADSLAILLSDLILSEEITPEKTFDALVKEGETASSALINLLSSHTFYDPLYPGYGRSPIFAAQILSKIQDESAIAPLFEAMGQENFFTDEEIIKALSSFGDKASSFLLKILKKEPFSKDNELAAIALSAFPKKDQVITKSALELLQKEQTLKNVSFATYLIFICSDLTEEQDKKTLITLSKKDLVPKELKEEIALALKSLT